MADLPAPREIPPLDLLLVARYGLLISLVHLIPIPVLDWLVDSWLRRRMTRVQLLQYGVDVRGRELGMLSSGDAGGCLGLVWSVISWPFRRLLRYVLWVLIIKAMIDTFSEVVARSILMHEACAVGALPGDAVAVRAAMQRARVGSNTKPIERAVGIVYRSLRGQLWRLWSQARSTMRTQSRKGRQDAAGEEDGPLDGKLESVSEALARALWVPEAHDSIRRQFREELRKMSVDATLPDPDDEASVVREVALPPEDPSDEGEPHAESHEDDA